MISYAVIFLYIAVALGEYTSFKRILVGFQLFAMRNLTSRAMSEQTFTVRHLCRSYDVLRLDHYTTGSLIYIFSPKWHTSDTISYHIISG